MNVAQKQFFEFFKPLLESTADYTVALVGGLGVKLTIEHIYHRPDLINTYDIDLTYSTTEQKAQAVYEKVLAHANAFAAKYPEITVTGVKLDDPNDFIKWKRFYYIRVKRGDKEFADLMISSQPLVIDQESSKTLGVPVLSIGDYLVSLFLIIYMSNVRGVSWYTMKMRHPAKGKHEGKGIKDIVRAQQVCSVAKLEKYVKYCNLLADLTAEKIKEMSNRERDRIFGQLKDLFV